MNKKKLTAFVLATIMAVVTLSGCSTTDTPSTGADNSNTNNNSTSVTGTIDVANMFSNRDKEIGYDESECVAITLSDSTAKSNSNAVKINGSTVTITDEGSYIISGNLSNGQIIVESEKTDKILVVLNGVIVIHPHQFMLNRQIKYLSPLQTALQMSFRIRASL